MSASRSLNPQMQLALEERYGPVSDSAECKTCGCGGKAPCHESCCVFEKGQICAVCLKAYSLLESLQPPPIEARPSELPWLQLQVQRLERRYGRDAAVCTIEFARYYAAGRAADVEAVIAETCREERTAGTAPLGPEAFSIVREAALAFVYLARQSVAA